MNVNIHGIRPEDVADAPTFPEASEPLMALIQDADVVIAHSAAFDIQVMRASAVRYDLALSPFSFGCTRVFSRRWFPAWPSYALTYCTAQLGIDKRLGRHGHHDPAWDAEACALIAITGFEQHHHLDWVDAAEAHRVHLGTFDLDVYRGCVGRDESGKIAPTLTPGVEFDPAHPLYGATVTFTGALAHYVRREAAQLVVDRGGHFSSNVTAASDLLVVGEQDMAKLAGRSASSKMRKAASMAAGGHHIEIIDEVDFYRLL
jgi:DNA polymerase-3 subunit epsilon